MATPTIDKLRFFYPLKTNSADGQALTQRTADAGGSVTEIVDSALIEIADFWNGAIGWFDKNTTTVALQGKFFHVKNFVATTDTLVLAKSLPAVPVAGDTFRLVLGGKWRTTQEVFGMQGDGNLPEMVDLDGTNILGLTIKKISPNLGEGTLYVFYDQAAEELYIKMDAGNYGVGLDVSGDVSDGIILDENETGYIQVDVTAASLPVGNETDSFNLTYSNDVLIPDYEGYETTPGKTRYRALILKNTDSVNTITALTASLTATGFAATELAEIIGTGEEDFDIDSATGWPTKSFWLYNSTKDDLRYIKYRSGNHLYCANPGGGLRGKTAVSWAIDDSLAVYHYLDFGIDAPSTLEFEDPANEETPPGGITIDEEEKIIGDLVSNDIYCIWIKELITAGHRARQSLGLALTLTWS